MTDDSDPVGVAVTNQKGGVGKSTVAANVGAALDRMGHDVLLLDIDPQGTLSSHFTLAEDDLRKATKEGDLPVTDDAKLPVPGPHGVQYAIKLEKRSPSVYEAFHHRKNIVDGREYPVDNIAFRIAVRTQPDHERERRAERRGVELTPVDETLPVGTTDGPDIVPSHRELKGIERSIGTEGTRAMREVINEFNSYDVVIIDVPANIDTLKQGSVVATGNVVIPLHLKAKVVESTRGHLRDAIERANQVSGVDKGDMNVVAIVPNERRSPGDREQKAVEPIIREKIPDSYASLPDDFDPEELPKEFWRGVTADEDGELLSGIPEELSDFWARAPCRPLVTDHRDYTDAVTPFNIRKRVAISEAASEHRSVFSHAPDCDQLEKFNMIAERINTLAPQKVGSAAQTS